MSQNLREELNRITVNSLLKLFTKTPSKPSAHPKIVIKYGPPAAGKGSAEVRKLIEGFGDPIDSYININVDDVVESTAYFKNKSRALVNTILKNPTQQNLNAFLNTAPVNEVQKFAKVYTDVRFTPNTKGLNIGTKLDTVLGKVIEAGTNITIETTGINGFPNWLWKNYRESLEHKKYTIIVIFPTVDFQTTWLRYKTRPIQSYKSGGGFRFASTKTQLLNQYKKSYASMMDALQNKSIKWVNRVYIIKSPSYLKPGEKASKTLLITRGATGTGLRSGTRTPKDQSVKTVGVTRRIQKIF